MYATNKTRVGIWAQLRQLRISPHMNIKALMCLLEYDDDDTRQPNRSGILIRSLWRYEKQNLSNLKLTPKITFNEKADFPMICCDFLLGAEFR